ncbi:hypothetical protein [Persephonella sp.]
MKAYEKEIIEGIEKILSETPVRTPPTELSQKIENFIKNVMERYGYKVNPHCKCWPEEKLDPDCPGGFKYRNCCECKWDEGPPIKKCGPWHCE